MLSVSGCDQLPSMAGVLGTGGSIEGVSGPDPLYPDQWHLKNTGQEGGVVGEDVNVEPVWTNYRGTGVRIVVVDDGLEIGHEDLAGNVIPGASWDYANQDTDPTGGSHGTAVAGVAAAVGDNAKGVKGVAPNAELVGYNYLQLSTLSNELDAMTRGKADNAVSSNSWGPQDFTGELIDSSSNWRAAIDEGTSTGLGGKGTVYTWAAGNGGSLVSTGSELIHIDNSNYDGYANYRGVFAIAALADDGTRASYSEPGANVLVATPSGEYCSTGHTTTTVDRSGNDGYNSGGTFISASKTDYSSPNYTKCFNGTSSATPVASGAIALMREANPNLTWRDVRVILARSARQNDSADPDWSVNGAGLSINHQYGFGALDAEAAVNMAQSWTSIGGSNALDSVTGSSFPNVAIADGTGTLLEYGAMTTDTITISASGINNIEFVEVTVTSDHTYISDLDIQLTSPDGTVSELAKFRRCNDGSSYVACSSDYTTGWRFGSVRHLDEAADGNWTLGLRDGWSGDTGNLVSWSITVYGR
ncbi:MAG: S8 family serine peptidase [Gammaproteobacteria bacterium]|nr:S8 family serine peptidase [Gammaproteobacteria bacterium]